jgi:DNA-binding transcriptional ArsR family regulator
VIDSAKQLKALRTPLRQEMVRTLRHLGAATVKELAAELGRKPASLYYHVHELTAAGIAVESKREATGGRDESSYALAAERIMIDRTKRSAPFIDALIDAQRATLRAAERELESATRAGRIGRTRCTGPESSTLLRLSVTLSPADARQASRMLREVATFMEEKNDPSAEGSYSLTAVIARLEERT